VTPEKAFAIAYAIRDYVEASHGSGPRHTLLEAIAKALTDAEPVAGARSATCDCPEGHFVSECPFRQTAAAAERRNLSRCASCGHGQWWHLPPNVRGPLVGHLACSARVSGPAPYPGTVCPCTDFAGTGAPSPAPHPDDFPETGHSPPEPALPSPAPNAAHGLPKPE
jgi:hypothetical protein